jgi:hypothetical protein
VSTGLQIEVHFLIQTERDMNPIRAIAKAITQTSSVRYARNPSPLKIVKFRNVGRTVWDGTDHATFKEAVEANHGLPITAHFSDGTSRIVGPNVVFHTMKSGRNVGDHRVTSPTRQAYRAATDPWFRGLVAIEGLRRALQPGQEREISRQVKVEPDHPALGMARDALAASLDMGHTVPLQAAHDEIMDIHSGDPQGQAVVELLRKHLNN